ncbi:MAG: rRNA maturation RNase YbeY [Pseudooceanicola atlanticus]
MAVIDCIIEDERWTALGLEDLAERAARETLAHLGLDPADFEIALLACDDARIAELNTEFRAKRTPTNVLSWPSDERGMEQSGAVPDLPDPGPDSELGDIAIAWETCDREAHEAGKSAQDHATHLIVHAVLHLLGYDHVRDLDATLMEQVEVDILGKMGLPDPYEV